MPLTSVGAICYIDVVMPETRSLFRPVLFFCFVVMLHLAALGSPAAPVLRMRAEPPEARVVILGVDTSDGTDLDLGPADGSALAIPLQRLAPRALYHVRLQMPGYRSQSLTLPWDAAQGRFSAEPPPVTLEPDSLLKRSWSRNPGFASFLLGAGVLALILVTCRIRGRLRYETTTLVEDARKTTASRVRRGEPDLMLGREVGGYLLLEKLGSGATSSVYQAAREGEAPVAIKLISEELSRDEEYRRRFSREERMGRSLQHEGLVRVHESGEHEGRLYLVMDLVSGTTLRDRIRRGRLALKEALSIFRAICTAVAAAHAVGVVHRDLKPENIMCTADGGIKIMDFGLARGANFSKLTQAGAVLGTPAYMAPEQIGQDDVDARCDQYALGVILFEICAGRPPFQAESAFALMSRRLTEEAPPLRKVCAHAPPAIENVVARMLSIDRELRFKNLEEVVAALPKTGWR